jgi:hypothetical protein
VIALIDGGVFKINDGLICKGRNTGLRMTTQGEDALGFDEGMCSVLS